MQKCKQEKNRAPLYLFLFLHVLAERSRPQINPAAILFKEEMKTNVRNASESDHIAAGE